MINMSFDQDVFSNILKIECYPYPQKWKQDRL